MLAEALAALASAGGTALVSAMVTDGWESVKERFARLLGRGDSQVVKGVAAQLEASRALLVGQAGLDLERARAEQEIAWRTRLADLLKVIQRLRVSCARRWLMCGRKWPALRAGCSSR
jgi:hypothetical protein